MNVPPTNPTLMDSPDNIKDMKKGEKLRIGVMTTIERTKDDYYIQYYGSVVSMKCKWNEIYKKP
jgi:hypothetical protein